MPRIARTTLPDGHFHVTSRGAGPSPIFHDAHDYRAFMRLLERTVERHIWTIQVYCLMGTHYHLVLEAQRERLSRGMHLLNGRYASWFNERHARSGSLFGGRYTCDPIRDEQHLSNACDYVLANPVRAGLCGSIDGWRWSGRGDAVNRV